MNADLRLALVAVAGVLLFNIQLKSNSLVLHQDHNASQATQLIETPAEDEAGLKGRLSETFLQKHSK